MNSNNTTTNTNAKTIDSFQIPFPTTLEALSDIDATRETPLLKALCNRRRIPVPGSNPTPAEILPIVQQRLAAHRTTPIIELARRDAEWREIHDDLQLFVHQLQTLLDSQTESHPPSGGTKGDTDPGTPGGTKAVQPNPTPAPSTSSGHSEIENLNSQIPSRQQLLAQVEEFLSAQSSPAIDSRGSQDNEAPTEPAKSTHANETPSPSSPVVQLSPGDQEITLDLHNTSPLDALPPERQQKLFQLLEDYPYRAVLRVLSMPTPHGWDLQTSVASLQRFYDRYKKCQRRQQIREAAQVSREILSNPDTTDAELLAASTHLANIRLLQTANNPNAHLRDLKDLFQIQIHLKSLDLAQQRLHLKKQNDNDTSRANRAAEIPTNSAPAATQPMESVPAA